MPEDRQPTNGEMITLTLTAMANGGKSLGRDHRDRVIFVPLTIPGERVRVELVESKPRFGQAALVEVLEPSPDRIEPRCPHFGPCGGCHFQHINYQAQLRHKESVIIDQLRRIGKFAQIEVNSTIENPEPWSYSTEVIFHRTADDALGFWSPSLKQIIPIEKCHIIRDELQDLYQQFDLNLESLRRLVLRIGDDGELLAALETDDNEPPTLTADFPISVNLLLPDGKTANLVGNNHTVYEVKGRSFRVTAGCSFYPSSRAAELVVDTVLNYASLSEDDRVVELYCGVGLLTAFLAGSALELVGIESNDDAIADLSANLDDFDNVTIYQGSVDQVLPILKESPDVLIVEPSSDGLLPEVLDEILRLCPERLIYIGSDIATTARDGRRLKDKGYQPIEVQPIDLWPQTYHVLTVSLWKLERQR
ncbi:MAG TPA: TRAM domain-containing protein [candidate division Zixibacteria bacterium]|nr:TRAM domain-containing protein [candidate division Zixibacteria bacterium]